MKFTCVFLTNGYGWFAVMFQSERYEVFGAFVPIQSWLGWFVAIDFMRLSPLDRKIWTWTDLVSICIPLYDYSDYNIYVFYNLIVQSSHARWRTTTSIETKNIFHPFPINRDVSSIYWQIRSSFHTASSMFTNMIVFHKNLSYGNIAKLLWVTQLRLSFAKSCLFLTCAQLPHKTSFNLTHFEGLRCC